MEYKLDLSKKYEYNINKVEGTHKINFNDETDLCVLQEVPKEVNTVLYHLKEIKTSTTVDLSKTFI